MGNLLETNWPVAIAGFVTDWFLTREWRRIFLFLIPLMLLVVVAGLVFWGSRLDRHQLAVRYLQLGEAEIKSWEESQLASPLASNQPKEKKASESISRYAEILFRRVQMLEPSQRSQYIIAATLAQQGAINQARRMVAKLAPDDVPGYPPAHALTVQTMLATREQPVNLQVLKHHVVQAVKSEQVPLTVLIAGSQLFLQFNEADQAIELLERANKIDPTYGLQLTEVTKRLAAMAEAENRSAEAARFRRISQDTAAKGEEIFQRQLESDPNNVELRLKLVTCMVERNKHDEAEKLLRDGMQREMSPALVRGLSEVYRIHYLQSLKQTDGKWSANLILLDQALRIDPTNPLIAEAIAMLARMGGPQPSPDLMQSLQQHLLEGKATAATHASLSEIHLIRRDFAKAIPHLEQVIARLPTAPQYLNNLAFVIAELYPDRLDEALKLAEKALQYNQRVPDFYDTLAVIHNKLGHTQEAIKNWESAVELQSGLGRPPRSDFHSRLAEAYKQLGNSEISELHLKLAEQSQPAPENKPDGQ